MIDQIKSVFEASSNKFEATRMSNYMKDKFPFYGIRSPQRKELTKVFHQELKGADQQEILEIVQEAWAQDYREFHYFAMEALFKSKRTWTEQSFGIMQEQIVTNSWWDTVDFVASNSIGTYLKRNPEILEKTTRNWNCSDNIWLIRTSIIFQLKYKDEQRPELLSEFILRHKDSKEFFIQKASGWALRQYAKYNADWVLQFVEENNLSALSSREALKHIG